MTGKDDSSELDGAMNLLRITLSVFSTSYNTILYIIYNDNFRKGFKKLLCCCLKTPHEDLNDQTVVATVSRATSRRIQPAITSE